MAFYRFNKKKSKWNKIDSEYKLSTDIKLEEKMIPVLEAAKKDCKNDGDFSMIIFGQVGSGKSTLGRLCCRYFSNDKFNPKDHMVRDVGDIKRVIQNAKKYDAIVFDEGSGIFASTDTLTKKTKYAQRVFDVCRQKNLLIVIIAPQLGRLSASIAIDRTKIALRTYPHKKTQRRGFFAFYGTKIKNELYDLSKKNHGKINMVRPKWRGEFGEDKTHDEEYKQLKDETLDLVLDSLEENKGNSRERRWKDQRDNLIVYIKEKMDLKYTELEKELKNFGIEDLTMEGLRCAYRRMKVSPNL